MAIHGAEAASSCETPFLKAVASFGSAHAAFFASTDARTSGESAIAEMIALSSGQAGGVGGGHVVSVSAGAGEHLRDDALGFGLGGVAVGLVV